jgi:hypothetical protein
MKNHQSRLFAATERHHTRESGCRIRCEGIMQGYWIPVLREARAQLKLVRQDGRHAHCTVEMSD